MKNKQSLFPSEGIGFNDYNGWLGFINSLPTISMELALSFPPALRVEEMGMTEVLTDGIKQPQFWVISSFG